MTDIAQYPEYLYIYLSASLPPTNFTSRVLTFMAGIVLPQDSVQSESKHQKALSVDPKLAQSDIQIDYASLGLSPVSIENVIGQVAQR